MEFKNAMDIEIIGFKLIILNLPWIRLELSDIDLLDIDLPDAD